jgi:EAL domain-containing protein (putative c-di-GMP-specific phosphodiesterase class I)
LELAFQPIADATTLRISSCEALVRWTHPQFGPVSPAEFVAIAEESGLIGRLGKFVVEAACRAALAWPDHVRVAVNLSPVEFRSPALFACVRHALEVTGLAPDRLELEITESLFLGARGPRGCHPFSPAPPGRAHCTR